MRLQVVTPQGTWVDTEVDEVRLPSVAGEMGVLQGHIPLVTVLVPGLLSWRTGGHLYGVRIGAGLATIRPTGEIALAVQFVDASTKSLAAA